MWRAIPILLTLTASAENVLLPEKIPPVVKDHQNWQDPAQVKLSGWVATRVDANATNRLLRLDPDRLLEGFRKRPGRHKWDGEHLGKWMHAATLAWAYTGDPGLRQKLDFVAGELAKCQLEDGYLGTYVESERWTEWDVWAHKYNLIGLVTYMRFTGNTAPLPACKKMADLLCETFGDQPGKRDIILAGQHIGMAPTSVLEPMVLLYRLTGEQRYLEFCRYILRSWEQPNGPKILSTLLKQKRVDRVGNNKAYEMLSCLNGALEYHRTVNDSQILQAALNAWEDIVSKRLYITGTASYREFFFADYDLPNVNRVGETCATVTWLQFNAQLLRLTGEARFAQQLERTVLNQLMGAQSLDGSAWGYYVEMQGRKPYNPTLDGHCCVSSGPRGMALVPTFAATTDEDGVVLNLYESLDARLTLRSGTTVLLKVQTLYPADDRVSLEVNPAGPSSFVVKLRIPDWARGVEVRVNGRKQGTTELSKGYLALSRRWEPKDRIVLSIPLEPRLIQGEFKNEGKMALAYGPLVLAADSALIGDETNIFDRLAYPGTLKDLQFRNTTAPAQLRTWEGARGCEISATVRTEHGSIDPSSRVRIQLVPFANAGAFGSNYKIWLPCKEPRPSRNLLLDGVELRSRKPNQNSVLDDFQTVANTRAGKPADQDWFGAELEEPVVVEQVVLVHGQSEKDGGWFNTSKGKPLIQVKRAPGAKWETICQFDDYPDTTADSPGKLRDFQRFTSNFPEPVRLFGLRVIGVPASGSNPAQAWVSCSELQAFAERRLEF